MNAKSQYDVLMRGFVSSCMRLTHCLLLLLAIVSLCTTIASDLVCSHAEAGDDESEHYYRTNRIRFSFSNEDAPRIHVLLACDVDARNIGETVKTDQRNLRRLFADARASFPNVQFNIKSLSGEDLTPDSIRSYYQDLETTADDVLFFYYSGHGATDADRVVGHPPGRELQDAHYLNMENGAIFRRGIRDAMEAKPHRLVVMLTDCCSNRDKVVLPGRGIDDGSLYKVVGMSDRVAPGSFDASTFRGLFLRCGGVVDISAASIPTFTVNAGVVTAVGPGETAVCNNEDGGIFTRVFLKLLAMPPSELSKVSQFPNSVFVDWMQMFGKLQPGTYNYRLGLNGSVLAGVDRNNHDAVVVKLRELARRVDANGSQRPFFFALGE